MKTFLDIYDVKNSQEQDEHGENCKKYIFFIVFFNFFFIILEINGTETLGGCPQLVTEPSRGCPSLVTEIIGVSITCH